MLRFLVDESSGSKLFRSLKDKGYDTLYCGDMYPETPDDVILDAANNDRRVLITNDKDFGEFIVRYKKLSYGVIFLRLKINNPENRIKSVLALIDNFGEKLNKNFVIVSENKIRIRKIKS